MWKLKDSWKLDKPDAGDVAMVRSNSGGGEDEDQKPDLGWGDDDDDDDEEDFEEVM